MVVVQIFTKFRYMFQKLLRKIYVEAENVTTIRMLRSTIQ
jgi:hypothetical protein